MEERTTRSDPQRMGDVVNRLMARRGYAQVLAQSDLEEVLAQAVSRELGQELAGHVRVGTVRRCVLEVFVSSSLVLQELTFRKTQIVNAVRQLAHGRTIKDIRFRVASLD